VEACSATIDPWSGLSEVEPVVRGWLGRRCRDQSDVDDVVQDTLLRAARYRGGLTQPERLASWAVSIAANTLRDRRRARAGWFVAEHTELELEEFAVDARPTAERGDDTLLWIGGRCVQTCDALEHLHAALRTLRPGDARLLLDHYGERELERVAERTLEPAGERTLEPVGELAHEPTGERTLEPAGELELDRAPVGVAEPSTRPGPPRTEALNSALKCRLYRARRRLARELRLRLEHEARGARGGA
jgi:DNA-directed RNA polymerase specialized sigma24 family protein